MRKKVHFITAAMSVFMALFLIFHLVVHVFAQSGDGFALDEAGNVTLHSEHAAKEGVSSLQFSLLVDAPATAQVAFEFTGGNASVCEYSYDAENKVLNVYMAGRNALFAENTEALSLGRIRVTAPEGSSDPVAVSVAGDSLKYVYGSDLKTMEGVELPGEVLLGSLTPENPQPTQTPRPTDPPTSSGSQGNNGNAGNGSMDNGNAGGSDILSPTASPIPTRAPQGGNTGSISSPVETYRPQGTKPDDQEDAKDTGGEMPPADGEDSPESTLSPGGNIFQDDGKEWSSQEKPGFTKPDKVEATALVVMAAVGAEFTFTGVMLKKVLKPGRKRYHRHTSARRGHGRPRRTNF